MSVPLLFFIRLCLCVYTILSPCSACFSFGQHQEYGLWPVHGLPLLNAQRALLMSTMRMLKKSDLARVLGVDQKKSGSGDEIVLLANEWLYG